MREKLTKRIKTGYNVLTGGVILLGLAAKVKKDILTHGEHEEHNPCPCQQQCLACLVK
jgi:hypothetical protein